MTEPGVLELRLPALPISALAWGPADGPLVLALHGFPDTAWTSLHAALVADFLGTYDLH